MALVKSVLRLTETEAVVKIAGVGGTATIDLTTDILASTQALDGATQKVNITGITWTGADNGIVDINRNGVRVATLPTSGANTFNFDGQTLPPENTQNTSNIVVNVTALIQAEVWIKLRKVSGYASKVETAQFSVYDNTTVVGS